MSERGKEGGREGGREIGKEGGRRNRKRIILEVKVLFTLFLFAGNILENSSHHDACTT